MPSISPFSIPLVLIKGFEDLRAEFPDVATGAQLDLGLGKGNDCCVTQRHVALLLRAGTVGAGDCSSASCSSPDLAWLDQPPGAASDELVQSLG